MSDNILREQHRSCYARWREECDEVRAERDDLREAVSVQSDEILWLRAALEDILTDLDALLRRAAFRTIKPDQN